MIDENEFPDYEPEADFDEEVDADADTGFDDVVVVEDGERIAKALARAGVCSRRDAEKLIADRRVRMNGKPVETPATLVTPHDVLTVDGKPVAKPQTTRVWRYHKPPGLVTTHHDPQGRPTVFDAMPSTMPRVISVGRLDLNSEGLLLLTNDGALARQFEHPSNGWTRRYRVRVFGAVDPARLALLAKGVTVDDVTYGSIQAEVERQSGANSWLTVTLTEGKNREIRRVMDYLGYRVNRLVRVSYGPFYIGRLERGELEEIPPKMLAELLDNVAKAGSADDVKPVRLDRTGWARAKPKPVRPGSRRPDLAAKADERRLEDGPRRGKPERSAAGGRPRSGSGESRDFGREDRPRGDRPEGGRPQGGKPG
ncbi:pseudouridine synthase, partial [Novispirillum itersonii]